MLTLEKLVEMNHWWKQGQVKDVFAPPSKRPLYYEIEKYIKLRQIIAVVGLRRVGKTTLLYQTIQGLIEKGTDPQHIIYFSFDEEVEELRDVLKLYHEKIVGKPLGEEKVYVFLDEITAMKDGILGVKYLLDSGKRRNITYIITGSSSVNLRKTGEYLPGRKGKGKDFHLLPFTFREYVSLVRPEDSNVVPSSVNMKELSALHHTLNQTTPLAEIFDDFAGFYCA